MTQIGLRMAAKHANHCSQKCPTVSHNIQYVGQWSIFNLLKTNAVDTCEHVCVSKFHFLSPKMNSFDQRDQSWWVGGVVCVCDHKPVSTKLSQKGNFTRTAS